MERRIFMASLIRGIAVTLFEKTVTGVDAFNAHTYQETPVTVKNVLVSPASSDELEGENQLEGKKEICTLHIPKNDTHSWENSRVEFRGQKWRTFGFVQEYIPENTPLDWGRQVKAVRYG